MDFISKFKETFFSVFPIVAVVVILNYTIAPLGSAFVPFLIGSICLLFGLSLFLSGTDIGMVPVGEKLGAVLANRKSVALMLTVGFVVGFAVTYAEPDVNVLALQVHSLNPSINENVLRLLIAVGLGFFIDLGLLRVLKRVKLRTVLVICYLIVFVILAFTKQDIASISFDASGATTGPLAVPFILALGLGVSGSSTTGQNDSFGLTGIASIGPIIAVGVMSLCSSGSNTVVVMESSEELALTFKQVFVQMLGKTTIGFGPLAAIIIILQLTLLKFPRIKFRKIIFGIVYSFVGIVIFLTGVEFGFSGVGRLLGQEISSNYPMWVTILIALVFGGIVVCAEPAVWVLTHQVEEVTAGRIKKSLVMTFLCIGVALAVALSILRIFLSISFFWFIYVGVGLSLILSFFCPPLFTGIAFDSGGVASGPMSTTFLLSFALGVSGSGNMGFGLVGLIAISPLIAIQVLGIIFKIKEKRISK